MCWVLWLFSRASAYIPPPTGIEQPGYRGNSGMLRIASLSGKQDWPATERL